MWPVWLSNVSVFAPDIVGRFCSTSKLLALFSLTIVRMPSPWPDELNASSVAGLKTAPSELPASGSVPRILPSFASTITITPGGCRRQATNST